jgi:uncharacterized protein
MRTGNWMCLASGTHWYVSDPHPDDVRIEDIAHALSLLCRFGGHTSKFYSVGQHSILVSQWLERNYPNDNLLHLYGLLHDGPEGLGLIDLPRPVKEMFPEYQALEHRVAQVMYQGLGLPSPDPDQEVRIKEADNTLLMTERRDLINHGGYEWSIKERPDPSIDLYQPMEPLAVKHLFLAEYSRLLGPAIASLPIPPKPE